MAYEVDLGHWGCIGSETTTQSHSTAPSQESQARHPTATDRYIGWLQVRQLLSIVLSILFFGHPINLAESAGK